MKKKIIAGIALTAVVAVIGVYKFRSTSAAYSIPTVAVKTIAVQEESVPREVHAIGTLVARNVEITPEIAGHINSINFKDGAEVKKGDALIQLDDAVYRAKYESAKAKLHFSENNYKRLSLLGKKGIIAQQSLDQAEADLKERKAETQEALVMMSKMKLTAPFDGAVGKSQVNPGDYVNVGQKLVSVTDTKHLRVEYNIPEQYLPLIKLGQKVKITAVAYPGKIFTGELTFISPTINTESRSISLYAEIDNNDNLLVAGMFVEAAQALGNTEHALMVPARSLVPVLDGAKVFKVVDGKAYSVSVVLGLRTSETVQVVQGLTKTDIVITDGQMKVKNGMPVKVQS